jgi:hypothetical protein
MLREMSFLEKLPIDNLLQISKFLDIEDIISLRRTDKKTTKYFDNKNFLNPLSFEKIGVWVNSFNEMLKLYNYKYITVHSLKYFSLHECFYKCGAEKDMKYAYFFKEKGANNYGDFFVSACQNGNIAAVQLALIFFNRYDEKTQNTAIFGAAKGGHLEILKLFNTNSIVKGFSYIADCVILCDHFKILKWVIEELSIKLKTSEMVTVFDGLICTAIKYSNFTMIDNILSYNIDGRISLRKIIRYCIAHGKLKMFKHLIYHKNLNNFVTSIDDMMFRFITKHSRLDIIKFLHTSEVIMFDQFLWDVILLKCYSDGYNIPKKDRKLMAEYSLFNGSKLYKTVISRHTRKKWFNLIEYISTRDDIFDTYQSQDYMLKVNFCDRNFNTNLTSRSKSMVEIASFLTKDFSGYLDYNDLFFLACQSKNTYLLGKVISKGYSDLIRTF